MRIFDGEIYRDATPEEEEAILHPDGEPTPSLDERLSNLEEELQVAKILLGVE